MRNTGQSDGRMRRFEVESVDIVDTSFLPVSGTSDTSWA